MNTKDKAIIYLDNSIKHLSELIKNSNVDSLIKDGKESLLNQQKALKGIKDES
jgi:hypothetical protein